MGLKGVCGTASRQKKVFAKKKTKMDIKLKLEHKTTQNWNTFESPSIVELVRKSKIQGLAPNTKQQLLLNLHCLFLSATIRILKTLVGLGPMQHSIAPRKIQCVRGGGVA